MFKISSWPDRYFHLLLATGSLVVAWLYSPGMQATDDLFYAEKANHVIRHGLYFSDTSHHVGRIGAYIPLALVLRIFGSSNFSLSLIPLLSTALTAVLVYLLGKMLYGPKVGGWSATLFIFSPLALTYGGFFVPEPMVCAELSAAALLFLRAGESTPCKLLVGGLCGLAYLTSEVGVIMLAVFLLYLLLSRQLTIGSWWIIAGFGVVVGLELLFYLHVYGDPLYRFTKLGGQYTRDPTLLHDNSRLLWRLFKAYPGFFLFPQLGLWLYGPLLAVGATYAVLHIRRNLFLVVWMLVLLLFYNFMSVSFSRYIVLPAALRLIYPACIPLLILSGKLLADALAWAGDRTFWVRVGGQTALTLCVMAVIGSSLLFCQLQKNVHFSALVARNAEAVAALMPSDRAITVVSDGLTLKCLSFYRGFPAVDTLIAAGDLRQVLANGNGDTLRLVRLVVNGPVYAIPVEQGGFFPYDQGQRAGLDAGLANYREQIFSFQFNKGRTFARLGSYDVVRWLYGRNEYEAATKLLATSWITVRGATNAAKDNPPAS